MKAWFTRIRQAVSGRLMTLKHKFGKAQFQRYRALLHARWLEAKDWTKESWLIVKCALLIAVCKLQMALTPEALRGYWHRLKNLPSRFTKENFKKWGAAFLAWLKSLPSKLRSMRKSGLLASLTLLALLLFMGMPLNILKVSSRVPLIISENPTTPILWRAVIINPCLWKVHVCTGLCENIHHKFCTRHTRYIFWNTYCKLFCITCSNK